MFDEASASINPLQMQRSQRADGSLRHLGKDRFEVFSAGTKPAGLNPNAIAAMSELGIDIAHHRSKSVDEFAGQHFDFVITVCDNAFPAEDSGFTTVSRILQLYLPRISLLPSAGYATNSLHGSTSS